LFSGVGIRDWFGMKIPRPDKSAEYNWMHDVRKVGELEIVQNRNETDVHKPRKIGEQSAEAGFSSHLFFFYHFFYLVFLLLSFFFLSN
jgi:hypothetical protein